MCVCVCVRCVCVCVCVRECKQTNKQTETAYLLITGMLTCKSFPPINYSMAS